MYTHAVIGAGNMGCALAEGWFKGRRKALKPDALALLDPNISAPAQRLIDAGAGHFVFPTEELESVEYVLLAVKPQLLPKLAPTLLPFLSADCVIISILAGIPLKRLEDAFDGRPIVRAMPNTPAAIGAGVTAYVCSGSVSAQQKKETERLLKSGGDVHALDNEALIDVVTAVSGSGPAYLFHMVEALQAAATVAGLPEALAQQFARQTIIGSAELLKSSESSARDLRRAVTSPNGTTQAALDVLMGERGLALLMRDTVAAAHKRAKELGQG